MSSRVWRWLKYSTAVIAGLLLIVAIGIGVYTRTDQFNALLRARVLAILNESLNAEVKFTAITGSVWREIEIHDLAVSQNRATIFSAPTVSVEIGLLGQLYTLLSSSGLSISRIDIVQPSLRLVQDQEKNWNFMNLIKKRDGTAEPRHLTISLKGITIGNGSIQVHPADGKESRLTDLSGKGALALLRSGIEAQIDNTSFALSSSGIPDSTWRAALSFLQDQKSSSVNIKTLNIATHESRLNASGTIRDLPNATAQLTIEITKISAKEIKKLSPEIPLREDIAGRLSASGPLSALQLSGTLAAHDGRIVASMLTDWTKPEPRLRGSLDVQDFFIEKVLTLTQVAGKVDGRVDFAGSSLREANASFRTRISQLAIEGWEIGQVALTGELKNKHLAFVADRNDKAGSAKLSANVVLGDTPAYEATLNARALDLKPIAGKQSNIPAAKINLDLSLKGAGTETSKMQADAKMNLYRSQIGEVRIDEGHAEASIRNGTVDLRQASIIANGSTLNARGTIASLAEQRPSGKIIYAINFKEMQPWLKLAGFSGSGAGAITGVIAGSWQVPAVQGNASLSRVRIGSAQLENARITWAVAKSQNQLWHGKVDLAARQINAGVSLQTIEAHLALDDAVPATGNITIVAMDLNQRAHRAAGRLVYSADRTEIFLQQLNLQLLEGTWSNPHPIHLVLAKKTITVDEFILQRNGQIVSAQGNIALEGAQDFSVRVSRFSLADLRPFLKDMPAASGTLSLVIQVKGTAARPLIETNINVDQLTVAGQPYLGLNGLVSYRGEQLNIDLRLLQDKAHELTVRGVAPVHIGWGDGRSIAFTGPANLRIRSDGLNPTFLTVFSKDIENVQGSLSMDILLRGTPNAPAPSGTIQFQNGGVRIRQLGIALSEINFQANLTPGVIQINQFVARSGAGQLTGNGRLAIKGTSITDLGVNFKAQEFQVINTREYKADASGNLIASGTLQAPLIRGGLTLKGTLRPSLALLKRGGPAAPDPTIVVVRNQSELSAAPEQRKKTTANDRNSAPASESQNPLYQRVGLDVTATISRGTWVYLDEGSIEVTGQLTLRKRPNQQLSISGTLEGSHGFYTFQGRRFQIESAELVFTGGSQIDPRLNIVGRYKVGQYQIDLIIGGYMTKPTLTLRSDPPLDQGDILAVLLFGKPATALTQSEKNVLQTQALQATANFISSDLRQSVARKLGLDTLEFGVGDNLAGGQLQAGKYITNDIFVSTSQQFGSDSKQEYSIEYDLAPNWQIKSSTTPHGNSGIDIFWHKQY